jgi:hypothetical protein
MATLNRFRDQQGFYHAGSPTGGAVPVVPLSGRGGEFKAAKDTPESTRLNVVECDSG